MKLKENRIKSLVTGIMLGRPTRSNMVLKKPEIIYMNAIKQSSSAALYIIFNGVVEKITK